jgi:formylglycine-generating enzyme required for sulfatase activity
MHYFLVLLFIISCLMMPVGAQPTLQHLSYSADISTGDVRLEGEITLETDLPIKTLSIDFGPIWQVVAGQLMVLRFNLPMAMGICRLKVREFGMPRPEGTEAMAILVTDENRLQRLQVAAPQALQTRFYELGQNLVAGEHVFKIGGLGHDLGIQNLAIHCASSSVILNNQLAHEQAKILLSRLKTGPNSFRDRLKDGSLGPEMIWIPAGRFQMGDIQAGGPDDEKPVHWVSIAKFTMGKYEVTFTEYDQFAQATNRQKPADEGWGRGNLPVINVTWDDAVAYTKWLSEQTGQNYRLPSEAEWEYAARAGTETKYWWGNQWEQNQANCEIGENDQDDNFPAPVSVGSFPANAFGLYDMLGNVREWVADPWHLNYRNAPDDGQIWKYENEEEEKEIGKYRTLRGGSWNDDHNNCRAADRDWNLLVDERSIGFRVVLVGQPL